MPRGALPGGWARAPPRVHAGAMLASALRSLVVVRCEGGDGLPARTAGPTAATLQKTPLGGGSATGLAWDGLGGRVLVSVAGGGGGLDRLRLLRAPGGSGPQEEELALPSAVGATDVSICCRPDAGATWAAVACTDGAVRVVDASRLGGPSVARTLYSHGVAATAVQISSDGQCLASGSASGHAVVEPFSGHGGPSPLPSLGEGAEAAVTGLRFSPLRPEILAGCDVGGRVQVWDAQQQRHICRFPDAHDGAVRGASFSMHNSHLLISGGDDSRLVFWDVTSCKQIREVGMEMGLTSLSYHAGGYLLAAGTCDSSVFVFDLRMLVSKSQPALPVHRFEQHQAKGGGVRALAFAPYECPSARASEADLATGGGAATDTSSLPDRAGGVESARSASGASTAAGEATPGVAGPTTATLQSMMGRLSSRGSHGAVTPSGLPPRSTSRTGAKEGSKDGRVSSRGSSASRLTGPEVPADGGREPEVIEFKSAAARPEPAQRPSTTWPGLSAVAALSATSGGTQPDKPRRSGVPAAAAPLPETPVGQAQGQASRFNIGSTPREHGHLASSPWWGNDQPAAALDHAEGNPPIAAPCSTEPANSAAAAPPAGATLEALRPLLSELREELLQEVREAQCAQLEQTFRLHAELRRDIDELRTEVQQLRGELRLL